jgi:hypothetical protein
LKILVNLAVLFLTEFLGDGKKVVCSIYLRVSTAKVSVVTSDSCPELV